MNTQEIVVAFVMQAGAVLFTIAALVVLWYCMARQDRKRRRVLDFDKLTSRNGDGKPSDHDSWVDDGEFHSVER